jgi:aromatic-L-amino-acid/L-tryptophan decarboxylase
VSLPGSYEMFHYDARMTQLIFDYCRRRLSLDPVPLDSSGDREQLDAVLAGLLGPKGTDPETVLRIFADHLAPAVISCDSPRFLSFIPAAPTKASLLFDMVVSCSSLSGISWLEAAGAVAAENQTIALLAHLAGMPEGAGGVFVSGGSAANLSALAVARDTSRRRFPENASRRLVVAVSEQAHSSLHNALGLLDMEALVVPTKEGRLTGGTLRDSLAAHRSASQVVAIAATAGTTNAGIVDDLAGIAEVAKEKGLWFHVDGAYGAAALFSQRARHLFQGIEHADSFVIDPHKWLFAPFDCAALVYRDPSLARLVHSQHASYLEPVHAGDEWNPSDYAFHLTRRARGLALWFSLAVHGTNAYSAAVETVLETAKSTAQRISSSEHLELVREPGLSIVLFRRKGWDREDYYRWSEKLLSDQIGFVTPTVWRGETVARFAFLHPGTTMEIVDEILATMT